MKYVPKFQQGGGFMTYTPFMPSMPTPMGGIGGSGGSGAGSAGKSPTSSILDDDTFKELLTKGGLVNDVNALVGQLAKMESANNMPYMQGNNRISALKMIGSVNELRQNKKGWEDALTTAEKSGGLNEVAIGTNKEVYVKDERGQIKATTLPAYIERGGKDKLLTVAELMNERQYNPALTGQNAIFNVANNSVGLTKITSQINDLIGAFGTETKEETKFYSKSQLTAGFKSAGESLGGKAPTEEEKASLQKLYQLANTPGEYFSIKNTVASEREHTDKALNYIWKTLGTSAQNKLYAVAAMTGEKDPTRIIADMITKGTNYSTVAEITPKELPGTSSTSTAAGTKSLGSFQMFHKDVLKSPDLSFTFNDPKLGVFLKGSVGAVGPLVFPDDVAPGMITLDNALEAGQYKKIVDTEDIFFGNTKVNSTERGNIILDNQDIAKVYMPVGMNGAPDWEEFKRFKGVYATYEANKQWTAQEATDFFKKNNYKIQVGDTYEGGQKVRVIQDNVSIKPFLLMYGYTNDRTGLIHEDDDKITKLSSAEEARMEPILKSVWTIKTGTKTTKDIGPGHSMWSNYYKGMITIPYRKDYAVQVDAMVNQGPKAQSYTVADVQRNLQTQPLQGSTSASVL